MGVCWVDSIGVKHGEIRSTRLRNVVSCRCVLRGQTALSERAGASHSHFFFKKSWSKNPYKPKRSVLGKHLYQNCDCCNE